MRKEFEINGCIEVQAEITEEEFFDAFIKFVESKGWSWWCTSIIPATQEAEARE